MSITVVDPGDARRGRVLQIWKPNGLGVNDIADAKASVATHAAIFRRNAPMPC